jgi:putative peptidoglycan lipid II flippase
MKMWHRFNRTQTISSGAITIALFAILSKALGLIRYSLIAAKFGTGPVADSYMAAFRIPDFIYSILVLGALSTAFIPIFLGLYHKRGLSSKNGPQDLSVEASEEGLASVNIDYQKQLSPVIANNKIVETKKRRLAYEAHWDLTNTLLNSLLLILLIIVGITWYLAPQIVPRLVSGFDSERLSLTVKLTRIMLLSPIIFAISNIMGSVLQSFKRFTFFAAAPVMYNIGIIIGILFFYSWLGPAGLAYGVVLGAMLHLLVQVPEVLRSGWRWGPRITWRTKGLARVLKLLLPRALALSANQVNQLVNTFLASSLAAGSVAVFYNAYDLESLPISLIAVSLAVASFPVLGELFVKNKHKDFHQVLLRIIKQILLLMIPLSLFMILLRAQIVRLILGYGRYNWNDTVRTLEIFGILATSLIAQGLIPVLARAFYARENTKTPVAISVVSIILNIVLAFILVPIYGLAGLAIAFSTASLLNCLLLWLILQREIKGLFSRNLWGDIAKYVLAAILGGLGLYLNLYLTAAALGTQQVWSLLIQTAWSFLIGAGIYVLVLWIFGDEMVLNLLRRLKELKILSRKLK